MTTLSPVRAPLWAAASLSLLLLSACGGDDGGINENVAGVTSASAAVPKYTQDLIITLQGRNLDKPILAFPSGNFFTGFACGDLSLSTTAPYVSTTTTAYYRCTSPQQGGPHVAYFYRNSTGDTTELATVSFTVPVPQVTLTISNGAGVTGNVVLTLEPAKAPVTVTNFLNYVNSGFYVDTVFHRLVPGFIIQGGGYAKTLVPNTEPLPTLKGGLNAPITLEDRTSSPNKIWTVAMARTSELNSATSQFFINLVDNDFLNYDTTTQARGYAVFGSVTAGTDVVTAMTTAPCVTWPDFFAGDADNACLPSPNLVVTAAVQTR